MLCIENMFIGCVTVAAAATSNTNEDGRLLGINRRNEHKQQQQKRKRFDNF